MPRSHWSYPLYRLMWQGLDLLLPPRCGGCKNLGSRWCEDCQRKVPLLNGVLCEKCGQPLTNNGGLCQACRTNLPAFKMMRSWAAFDDPVRPALHKLKYRRDLALGDALAVPLAHFLESLDWPVDVIVPVPLGHRRLQERGYNQVALVARPLALALGLNYGSNALHRARETRSQVGLSALERRRNVADAFQADVRQVYGKNILVIDDVSTTGSTLSSCAQALRGVGAKDVYALTVARALAHHGLQHA